MPSIQLNDTQLHYLERGQGEPLVLVHGTLGDYRSWELQLKPFAKTYRTITYSRRYHHPNPCPEGASAYSATLHADDLAALIEGLEIDSAHVVGTSYGAYTALLLAARHPERVRALVLGDPPVFPLLEHSTEGRTLRHEFLSTVWEPAAEMMREGRTRSGIRAFVDGVVEEGVFDQFSRGVREMIMANACEFAIETASPDFFTPFSCEDARQIATPTLLLTGDKSRRLFQLIIDELERCLPNSETVRVPETTHELSSDNPDAYNEIVLKYLARHTA